MLYLLVNRPEIAGDYGVTEKWPKPKYGGTGKSDRRQRV